MSDTLHFTQWGKVDYQDMFQRMQDYTIARDEQSPDHCWHLEHPAVYTLGQAGKREHILNPKQIPVVQSDRGGQVTYHGPGQLVSYLLVDIQRKKINIRCLVDAIELAIIDTLTLFGIESHQQDKAPGVYVEGAKIASLGLRVKKGRSYHGLSLNVDMDLDPFLGINPCGYTNLKVVQMRDYCPNIQMSEVIPVLNEQLLQRLDYRKANHAE